MAIFDDLAAEQDRLEAVLQSLTAPDGTEFWQFGPLAAESVITGPAGAS